MDIEAQHAALTTIIFCAVTGKSEAAYCRLPPRETGKWGRAAIAVTAALRARGAVPSDAELDAVIATKLVHRDQDRIFYRSFARAVLARWGAAPAAPMSASGAVPDERAAFEKWATETMGASVEPWMEHAPEAGYKNTRLNDYRDGWFARAALAAPQPPAALPGDTQ